MKIYKLSVQTHMYRYYFFPTKKEAEVMRSELRRDTNETVHDANIEELEFPATRKGVAELLSDFVSQTCMNEG